MATERELQEVGKSAMASIREMVDTLECDYERLEELRDELSEAFDGESERNNPSDEKAFRAWVKNMADSPDGTLQEAAQELLGLWEAAGDCEDQDEARERIMEDPLSLEFRSGWVSSKDEMEPEEYCLLLGTGGPAVRIIGEVRNGEAYSARLEVQDWGTPWTEIVTRGDDHNALLAYARCFCMGE